MDRSNPSTETSFRATGKRVYTVDEIARILKISRSKAYGLCKQGLFGIIRVGRSVRISKASFDEWLDNTYSQ